MKQRVGTCSICGGCVYGHRGGWMAVVPPPPDRCIDCGATRGSDVIPMTPPKEKVRKPKEDDGQYFARVLKENEKEFTTLPRWARDLISESLSVSGLLDTDKSGRHTSSD